MVWLNEQDAIQSVLMLVKPNNKQTGWILQCQDFDCFCWNSDKILVHLLTALEKFSSEGKAVKFVVTADTTQKRGFTLAKVELKKNENFNPWLKIGNYFKVAEDSDLEEETNPFL